MTESRVPPSRPPPGAKPDRPGPESLDSPRFRFLSTMTHELRTPLVAILGYADVLLEELTPGRPRSAAEGVRRQGEHLLGLIDDLLDLVRLNRGELEILPSDGDLREVVARTVLGLVEPAREKGLELRFETSTDAAMPARFDPARVRQVVRHLVDNAVKFTPSGSVVVRLALEPRGFAVIAVLDTGPGLTPARFDELCEPLAQGDDRLARGHGGCGVGLALCRALARRMRGELTCWGDPETGTAVRFRFPVQPVRRRPAPETRRAGPLRGHVLLVEDSPDNQRLIRRILERVGLQVTLASDGRAGVEAALSGDFDLVLMDVQMPELDGLSATRELRERGFTAPILAMTANTEPEARQRCLDAGCDDFLTKPLDRMVFLERLVRLLGRKRQNSV